MQRHATLRHRPSFAASLIAVGALVFGIAATLSPASAAAAEANQAATRAAPAGAPHRHANAEHPAVRIARLASRADGLGIGANTFIVQPPASVRWTLGPDADPAVHLATRGPAGPDAASR